MTNNMGKNVVAPKRKKSHTLPPLEGGTQSPACRRSPPPPTAEGRRRTRSVEPAHLPLLDTSPGGSAGQLVSPQRALSVESVHGGRPAAPPGSPRAEHTGPVRAGSFRLKDGLQHRQPKAAEPDQPIAAPRGGKPLNLQPIDARRPPN